MRAHKLIASSSLLEYASCIKSSRKYHTTPPSTVELYMHSSHGGRNLSERFLRLEKMLLAKHNLSQPVAGSPRIPKSPGQIPLSTPPQQSIVTTFKGFVIPEAPKPPGPDECCMSGCVVCVHDSYQESLDTYNLSVASVRASLTAMKIPVGQWPKSIRPNLERGTPLPTPNISLSAFEDMERSLKARREASAQS
ncbi:hypothetical protein B0F90DRAFT_1703582 [Multifurca ochricompacta]|uniref:Oxidoreductase-like domain-containing protein n=1 Tax=Multifurca ochricompacta TaxID=376703 RepID=A0AAD4M8C3_9AGAM|nr:hypothetical protein B0F90DRAFT_1703582 [Multifurca ochricompacta]